MNGSVARGSAVNETKIVDDVFVCGQDNCRALRFKYSFEPVPLNEIIQRDI